LSNARHQLKTTLFQLGGNYAALERHLLRNFRKYAHRRVVERVLFPGLEGSHGLVEAALQPDTRA
jgi:hypothetical protein